MTDEVYCRSHEDIKCPYCKHSHILEAESVPWDDNNDIEYECRKCGKEFLIQANISVSWTTSEIE